MQQMIRKEVSEYMSAAGQQPHASVRRSRRAPVPNRLYKEALSDLKKSDRMSEPSTCPRRNPCKKDSSNSSSGSLVQQEDSSLPMRWLKCLLPDDGQGSRLIDLEVLVGCQPSAAPVCAHSGTAVILGHQSKCSPVDSHEDLPLQVLAEPRPRKIVKYEKPAETKPGLLQILWTAVQKVARQIDSTTKENAATASHCPALKETSDNTRSQLASRPSHQIPKKKLVVHYPWKLVQPHHLGQDSPAESPMFEQNPCKTSENSSGDFMEYEKHELRFHELSNRFSSLKESLLNTQKAN